MTNVFGFIMAVYHSGVTYRFALETIRYFNLKVGVCLDNILESIG